MLLEEKQFINKIFFFWKIFKIPY